MTDRAASDKLEAEVEEEQSSKRVRRAKERRKTERKGEKKAKRKRKARKGARGMPVALGGEEGRDKLRKAARSGKCTVMRGCPNGETRRERSRHQLSWGERGELKHLSTRRKRK